MILLSHPYPSRGEGGGDVTSFNAFILVYLVNLVSKVRLQLTRKMCKLCKLNEPDAEVTNA
jgi:hypothetical protein